MSKSAGWLARSLLRGCFVETEEILVLVNMGFQSENLVRWRVAPCAVTPLLRGWRGRARSMNVYVREEEWEGVIREVVGGKTAEPNAHQCAQHSLENEVCEWNVRCGFRLHPSIAQPEAAVLIAPPCVSLQCMMIERCPTNLMLLSCFFVSSS